jgi:hypothetical protein
MAAAATSRGDDPARAPPEGALPGAESLPATDLRSQLDVGVFGPRRPTPCDHEDRPTLTGAGGEAASVGGAAVPGRADHDQVQRIEQHRYDRGPTRAGVRDEGDAPEVHAHGGGGLEPEIGQSDHRRP